MASDIGGWLLFAIFAYQSLLTVSMHSEEEEDRLSLMQTNLLFSKKQTKSDQGFSFASFTHPWSDRSLDVEQRVSLLLAEMFRGEKENMLHGYCNGCPFVGKVNGNERLGIPPLNTHDGPQGFRNMPGAGGTSTSFPSSMAVSATWDPDAVYDWGVAMGQEFKAKGANVFLGPGLNIARVPNNGRNFEYMAGEDPFLGKVLSKQVVKGVQEQKVMACAKHWAVNSQETHRLDGSEDVDERTLFEIYYPPFEGALEADVGSVMCSYNYINGKSSCDNDVTLGQHLKKALGFEGFVMSDWGGTRSSKIGPGRDIEMPFPVYMNPTSMLLRGESNTEEEVDNSVTRILRSMFKVGLFDEPQERWHNTHAKFKMNVSSEENIALARRLGADSTVLLKNEKLLPLPQNAKLALIGHAEKSELLAYGRGSGEVKPSSYVSPMEGITAAAGRDAKITYNDGKDLDSSVQLAKDADYAIVFAGALAGEQFDRNSLSLDGACQTQTMDGIGVSCLGMNNNQNAVISAVAAANPKTIVVLSIPGAVTMPWSPSVSAILTNFLPGQQAGNAIADVLYGKVNPSAKLPITMPNAENDMGFTEAQMPGIKVNELYHLEYSEKLLVGYRWYEAKNVQFSTGFPFGHGLSYTTWEYNNLQLEGPSAVTFQVKNSGNMAGREVAQLYLTFPKSAEEPPLQLKGFKKTALLQPGETETVSLKMSSREFSIWDELQHDWWLQKGEFKISVGSSSRDIRLTKNVDVKRDPAVPGSVLMAPHH